ncbi:hypothetical protein FF098_009775 [Parvularcula flava]|uniref:UPF0386 protein FF098_009775 n=1 Tax=Aquisalinus luteolus TaxID=1566827 RepID=A0A8J3A3W6_9PROT|nr:YjhX family toxin [Aquisalinus luteolus]NHK28191.1 hypothetical protein [Aquisalinus luteolus]GGH97738.1 UPF0386 protein [Aquisalinus luteolus]
MNISKAEQRTLHVLARGGCIAVEKDDKGRIIKVNCVTPEGWSLADCTLALFKKLKKRRFIASYDSRPYTITYDGRKAVRGQLDNRG